jgi:uncharacterized protein with PIN domain
MSMLNDNPSLREGDELTDSQREACAALLELLGVAEGACDRCDYCNCPLVTVTFTTPQQSVSHRHCLNCGGVTLIGEERDDDHVE